jgi:Transglycosylase-like domain
VRRLPGGPVLFAAVAVVAAVVLWMMARCTYDAAAQEPPPTTPGEAQARAERDKARRYADRLERVVRRLVRKAERQERTIKRDRRATRRALRRSPAGGHWIERAFLCIHEHEGGWRAATGNGYYGGLQMDRSFQRAYGREYLAAFGTANNWPMSVQLAVAIEGWTRRGFSPWPNTRRRCGL